MTTFHGPPAESETGIGALTLPGFLDETWQRHAERDAIVFLTSDEEAVRWTYDDLHAQARQVARGLLANGVGKGTRVGLLMPNRPEWVASAFGIAMAGGVVVPFSTLASPDELAQLIHHSDVSILLVQTGFARDPLTEVGARCPGLLTGAPRPLHATAYPFLRRVFDLAADDAAGAVQPWEQLLAAAETVPGAVLDACIAAVTPADDAIVIYTSGTTASPKGVLHPHRSPSIQSWRFAARQRLRDEDRVFSAFPFFWTAGFAMVMGATLAAGACLVVEEVFSPEGAMRAIQDERVTSVHAWPHQTAQIRDHPRNAAFDLSSIRRDGHRFRPGDSGVGEGSSRAGYGMSEMFSIASSAPVDAGADVVRESHGYLLPGNAMRVIDPATGQRLGAGAEGELAVKGRTMMRGYLKLPPEACFDEDGFFHSGDTGYVDDRGLVHWTGRQSDLIKTGGANVSPVELESVLATHPRLAAAAAVGVPDQLLGEVVVACAIPRPGCAVDEDDVRRFARERLSSYKVPRRVLFFDETELPLTGNDKVQLAELRRIATQRLEAAAPARAETYPNGGPRDRTAAGGAPVEPRDRDDAARRPGTPAR